MPDLYPPSTERDDRRLQAVMEELVHDVARTDPDSRHFQLLNPGRLELSRTLSIVRRLDTRPWAADVRQTASVGPAEGNEDEVDTASFLYGVPDGIELRERYRWGTGTASFRDDEGIKPALSDLTAVFLDEEMILQSGRSLYRMDGPADVTDMDADVNGQIISSGPGGYGRARGNNSAEGEVAVQVDGLDIRFAGRGYFDIDVRFTGVATVQDADDLSNLTGYVEALKLYDADQNETDYTLSGTTINISDSGDFTLYYEGEWTKDYEARGSTRLGELPEQSVSLVPIAEDLYDVPSEDQITCVQPRTGGCPLRKR
jgi:hypothetical protein